MSTVLITGAGRGIGRAIAVHLAGQGWDVYAGVRKPADGDELVQGSPRITPVVLDITDGDQIGALPERLGGRLDAIVNNAGIVVSGPVEALAIDDLRRQFDVNLVGQVAVTQAVLPLLRSAHGRVVFISSISGRVSSPFMGAYASSKFALEGLADALRVELRPWRIRVCLIEPGSVDTDLWRNVDQTVDEVEAGLRPEHRQLYGGQISAMRKVSARIAKSAAAPDKVVDAVEHALTASRPKPRYVVGTDARVQLAASAIVPARVMDAIVARVTGGR
jgi:NAD(P)-dependent dehydrogenase (short-subunit alcohol dehydrogenase family)